MPSSATNSTPVYFITGISRGFGAELARIALDRGYRVIGTTRNGKSDIVAKNQNNFHVLALDVSQQSECEKVIEKAYQIYHQFDVIINNAGYALSGYFEEFGDKDIRKQIDTNLFGPITIIKSVLPYLRKQRSGHIINVSSIVGVIGYATASVYSASKWALTGLSESLGMELKPFNIQVTSVEPGPFRTDILENESTRNNRYISKEDQIADYDKDRFDMIVHHQKQPGDPVKGSEAIIKLSELPASERPVHLLLGNVAFAMRGKNLKDLDEERLKFADLTNGCDFDQSEAQNFKL